MPRKTHRFKVILILAIIAGGGAWWWVRCRNITEVERGRRVAQQKGCFNCHGDGGHQGIANPGSEEEEIPAWSGGTHMMYIHEKSETELREWILYGEPRSKKDDPSFQTRKKAMLIKMPAYEGKLCDREVDLLVAYFRAVSGMDEPPRDSIEGKGYREAREHGCFGCHGPMGIGSPPNPGSFTGYVPGWSSSDFDELVKDDPELEEWILEGSIHRFEENPLARFFLKGQKVKMPAYKGHLDEEDLSAIKAYIRWVYARGPGKG